MDNTSDEKIFSGIKLTLEVILIELLNHFNEWVFLRNLDPSVFNLIY